MTKESVALGVAGVLFGFLTGWIIGAQQARPVSGPRAFSKAARTWAAVCGLRATASFSSSKAAGQSSFSVD